MHRACCVTSSSSPFTMKAFIITLLLVSVMIGVYSAPTTEASVNDLASESSSSVDSSAFPSKDTEPEREESPRPPAGVFVSPWSGLDGRSNVRVGLPFIFGMDLDRNRDRSAGNQTRLDLGVLGGLVRVSMDRFRGVNGTKSGPVEVSIFGIPITSG